jgi:hypothetical protein
VGLSPSSREGTPLKAAPIVVCARTSLAVPANDDAQTSANACALRPHATSGGELKARDTRAARRPLRMHRR